MANSIERIGVSHCAEIAERNNWMFREQPINDIGIDAHMEYMDPCGRTKQLLALQIKTGESWFKEEKDGCIIFRHINERQYNYWTTNSLPCILVIYNPISNICIWQELTSKTIKRTKNGKGKGFFVEIPLKQVFLDYSSIYKLLAFSNLPDYIVNYNFLLSQIKFMEIIAEGGQIKLHSNEWVHKSSGRGDIELIIDDGENVSSYLYPYWFPFTSYTDVFPRLFPWAEFRIDEDFYEESDFSSWREYNCCYDNEDDEWIVIGETFEEFRKKLNPIRSIDHAGEVAEYMLILDLNELGKAFLKVNKFVSQNQSYVSTRPKKK